MSTPPYTTGKTQEGGALATRKQDFNSHVSGGAFYHTADSVMMSPPVVGFEIYSTVQSLLTQVAITSSAGVHGGTITIGDRSNNISIGDVNVGDAGISDLGDAIRFIVTNISTRFFQLVNGGTIFIKAGRYTLKTPAVLPAGVSLVGEDGAASILIGYPVGWNQPCISINGISTSYVTSMSPPFPRSLRQARISCIKNLIFANDPADSLSYTLSQSTLFTINVGANVLFDNVSYLGQVGVSNVASKSFMSIGSAVPGGDDPYTFVKMNNCYIDTVQKIIESGSSGYISNTSTVEIENCLFRVYNSATTTDWTGVFSVGCTCTIQNSKFIRVSDISSYAPMVAFTPGSGSAPSGKRLIINVNNNVGYTENYLGILRPASGSNDFMFDPGTAASLGYVALDYNNTYL